ncbi:MAG: aldo/keto reductase [Desulfohalobiaceae bacterium]
MFSLPTIPFTPDGPEVTRVGLGGEGVLRTFGQDTEARAVIQEAIAQSITYFDTAPAYSGSQAYLGSIWREQPETRKKIFQTSKSAGRTFSQAMQDLETSLKTLHTDSLDLWQIHDVRTIQDLRQLEARDGALNAFIKAREQGLVKHIGVTGHHDPHILQTCVRNWPLDSVLLPANPVESNLDGFLDLVVQQARDKNMAVIGMKCLGARNYVQPDHGLTAEKLIRYALFGTRMDVIIVGCSTPNEVQELAQAAQQGPLSEDHQTKLENIVASQAQRLAFYRGRS